MIYDDTRIRYRGGGGFPRSFLEKLPKGGFRKLYENSEVVIWSPVKRDVMNHL
jgi:hypothetical protein